MLRSLIAIAALSLPALAWADEQCSVEIHGTDQMTFNLNSISVPASCKTFTVNLVHPGTLPKNVMGHNWVLTRQADMQAVTEEGAKAGEAHDYIKEGDERVLAHTRLIGANEKASVSFDTALLKTGGPYVFFCSYPFHSMMMKGSVALSS